MPSTPDDTLLIFRIDCIPVAVPAASVQSIVMPPQQLTQPPGSNRARPGIFRHAEQVYAVVDLHQRFGIDTPRKGTGRLLLHENGMRRHALWVDEVVGLVRSEEGQWAQLPHYLPRTLFHNGFLHHQEIVLCSSLEALLTMHDAGPIHRHLENLRQGEAATHTSSENKNAPPTTEKKPRPGLADMPKKGEKKRLQSASAETPQPKQTLSNLDTSATPSRVTKHPTAAAKKPVTLSRAYKASPKPSSATRAITRTTSAGVQHTISKRPLPAQVGSAAPRKTQENRSGELQTTTAATVSSTSNRWLLWSLLIILLPALFGAGLYLLLDEPAMEEKQKPVRSQRPSPPPIRPQPRPVEQSAPVTPSPPQAPPEAATTLPVEPAAVAPSTLPNTLSSASAIQIERDEEGTINLIIQREQLRQPPLQKQPPEPESTTQSIDAAEQPLEPDTDWPVPASLPEPCDCTHIVVKGDTLWDIAQQYTNNAFNYPELARQSGIRNPHRIYPGNKVRIIVR